MKCRQCDHKNPDDTIFCGKCGTKLVPAEKMDFQTKTLVDKRPIPRKVVAGKYRLLKELGRGGMGIVYEALDEKLKRTVALKFLPQDLTRDREARERFVHEAQAASQLDHPNICTVHEVGEDQGRIYIAMACYQGENLKKRIRKEPLPIKQAIDLALQAAQGLAKAHEKKIVHRDIKPANMILTTDGVVKIVDFGLAKLSDQTRITRSGTTMGTVAYMSPEQAKGEGADQRADVWSLGTVLYEMLTGELPFKGARDTAVVYSILHEEPQSIETLTPDVPFELEEIVKKALQKNPDKRFFSAKDMAEALQKLQMQITAEIPLDTVRQHKRRSIRYALLGAAAGIIGCGLIMFLWMTLRPSLAFSEHDKLLLADVDNQTGDEVFNLALRTAIEADLQQSPYASIFDKGEVTETLRMMQLDPASQIDEVLGCDICRFAGVRALILPRILSAGEAYELQAILVDPVRHSHVDRIRVKALGREDVLLNGIDELAQELRSRLGESLASIEKADKPLVEASTSSWEALHYLSMGQAKWHEGKFKEAATFFELALEKDPKFVAARGSFGLLLIQWLNQKPRGKEELKQALMDAEGIPEKEYLMIKAINKEYVNEDQEGALDAYRMIYEIYPDVSVAYNNSGMIYRRLGRYDEAVAMFEKASEIMPSNSIHLANLLFTHLSFRMDPVAAEEIGRRIVALSPKIAIHHHWLGFCLAAQARFQEAIDVYAKALDLEPLHDWALPNMAHLLLASGRAAEAVPYYRKVRGQVQAGRIQGYYPLASFDLAMALREAGELEEAKKIAEEGDKDLIARVGTNANVPWIPLLRAKLTIIKGENSQAEEFLNQALKLDFDDAGAYYYLAEVYILLGNFTKGLESLQTCLDMGYRDPYFLLILPGFQPIRNDPRFLALFQPFSK